MNKHLTDLYQHTSHLSHRFLDEAGDLNFFGKGGKPILGKDGVSNYFFIGMLTLNEPLKDLRTKILSLQENIEKDSYFKDVPSIIKRQNKGAYFLHAKEDLPEIRKMVFDFIATLDCYFESVMIRKDYYQFKTKHKNQQSELYSDMLSHLLLDHYPNSNKMILNIAHRSKCTSHKNLENGLIKTGLLSSKKYPGNNMNCKIVFNVQYPSTEPIINLADYFLWAIQRKWERKENRFFDYVSSKIKSVRNIYEY
jgi:hypothetical protein